MVKKKSGQAAEHEHVWLKLVYGRPTDQAIDAVKAGRVILANRDRRDADPRLQCAVCEVQS